MEGWHTLVVVLQARDKVCFVARLGEAALLEQLLEVGDLQGRVVGHFVRSLEECSDCYRVAATRCG